MKGAQRNLYVYGCWTSVIMPSATRLTPSTVAHAWKVEVTSEIGRPEPNPRRSRTASLRSRKTAAYALEAKVAQGYNFPTIVRGSPMEKIVKTEEEWKALLTPEQFKIARKHGTERPFTGPNHDSKEPGVYHCVACDLPLFNANTKFDSGTGWP